MTLRIETANPSTMALEPSPFPREWVIEGNPRASGAEIARTGDSSMRLIVWSCTEGRFRWEYSIDETVQILSGEVWITDHNNDVHRLGPGDSAFFPAGTTSVWHVTQTVRKVAVCRAPMPRLIGFALRAWNWAVRRAEALAPGGAATSDGGLIGGASRQGSLV